MSEKESDSIHKHEGGKLVEITPVSPKVTLTEEEYVSLLSADEDQAQNWLSAHGIAPGDDLRVVVKGVDGTVFERSVDTSLDDFFTTIKDLNEPKPGVDHTKPQPQLEYIGQRTLEMRQLLDESTLQQLEKAAIGPDALDSTVQLMENKLFKPVSGLDLGDVKLAFSQVFTAHNRRFSIGYAQHDGSETVAPRLFYESKSDGGWRVTPGVYYDGVYSKGEINQPQYGQYVQLTKLDESVTAMLEGLARHEIGSRDYKSETGELDEIFSLRARLDEEPRKFEDEVTIKKVVGPGMDAFIPGEGFHDFYVEDGREKLEKMEIPSGFEPDFTAGPDRQYGAEHTLLGKTSVDVFKGKLEGRDIEWHVARDAQSRIWIDRITYTDSAVTDYGTASEVILAGALNSKPIEYAIQVRGAVVGEDIKPFDKRYVDLAPTINRMPWAKRYRAALERRLYGKEVEPSVLGAIEDVGEAAVELAGVDDPTPNEWPDILPNAVKIVQQQLEDEKAMITGIPEHLR